MIFNKIAGVVAVFAVTANATNTEGVSDFLRNVRGNTVYIYNNMNPSSTLKSLPDEYLQPKPAQQSDAQEYDLAMDIADFILNLPATMDIREEDRRPIMDIREEDRRQIQTNLIEAIRVQKFMTPLIEMASDGRWEPRAFSPAFVITFEHSLITVDSYGFVPEVDEDVPGAKIDPKTGKMITLANHVMHITTRYNNTSYPKDTVEFFQRPEHIKSIEKMFMERVLWKTMLSNANRPKIVESAIQMRLSECTNLTHQQRDFFAQGMSHWFNECNWKRDIIRTTEWLAKYLGTHTLESVDAFAATDDHQVVYNLLKKFFTTRNISPPLTHSYFLSMLNEIDHFDKYKKMHLKISIAECLEKWVDDEGMFTPRNVPQVVDGLQFFFNTWEQGKISEEQYQALVTFFDPDQEVSNREVSLLPLGGKGLTLYHVLLQPVEHQGPADDGEEPIVDGYSSSSSVNSLRRERRNAMTGGFSYMAFSWNVNEKPTLAPQFIDLIKQDLRQTPANLYSVSLQELSDFKRVGPQLNEVFEQYGYECVTPEDLHGGYADFKRGYKLLVFAQTDKVAMMKRNRVKLRAKFGRKGMVGMIFEHMGYCFGISSIHFSDIKNKDDGRTKSLEAKDGTLKEWVDVVNEVKSAAESLNLEALDWWIIGDHNPRTLRLRKDMSDDDFVQAVNNGDILWTGKNPKGQASNGDDYVDPSQSAMMLNTIGVLNRDDAYHAKLLEADSHRYVRIMMQKNGIVEEWCEGNRDWNIKVPFNPTYTFDKNGQYKDGKFKPSFADRIIRARVLTNRGKDNLQVGGKKSTRRGTWLVTEYGSAPIKNEDRDEASDHRPIWQRAVLTTEDRRRRRRLMERLVQSEERKM